ncbi:unnamed protein product [Arctia plantaginis]|uniref:FP protein C-terminal domain-containing protein n=1 Tax=Arctia plantaginis TaxID=874455 RepID=A0A8S0Z890_ARCPL|nr:unnamed protein product [Arctia plantaginis]
MAALRTPPGKPNVSQHVLSESDIANLDPETPLSFVGRRPKIPRKEDSQKSEDSTLKEELLSLLTNWKKDQDATLSKLCADMAELKQQNCNIQATSDELEKSIKFMSSQYEDIRGKLLEMERERTENLSYIITLENKIEDMQKKLKSTVIEFRNLPQQVKDETQQDLCELVQKTCSSVNTSIESSEIRDIFRLTTKLGTSIVVTDLTTVLIKNRILSGVREFNQTHPNNKLSSLTIGLSGPTKPIYVVESLTNKNRKLYSMARETAKTLDYKYCWNKSGNIYMRKNDGDTRLVIRKESDLTILKKQ